MEARVEKQRTAERRWPWALVAAIAIAMAVEAGLWTGRRSFLSADDLIFDVKLERVEGGFADDVIVLGASEGMAGVRPELLGSLPRDLTVYNYALPGMGPSGGDILLRRHLAAGSGTRALILTYSAATLGDTDILFGWEGRIRLLYRAGDVLKAVGDELPPAETLTWLATRLPSVRFRRSVKETLLSLLLDVAPPLEDPLRRRMGFGDGPLSHYKFAWLYRERAERNRRLAADLAADRGWRYFRDHALPGERLPERARLRSRALNIRESERRALARIVARCRDAGIRVVVAPVPLPRSLVDQLGEPALALMESLFEELYANQPHVVVHGDPLRAWPHRRFSDRLHLNPQGAARFTHELEPTLSALLVGRGPASRER
jgi:hypothetical protein